MIGKEYASAPFPASHYSTIQEKEQGEADESQNVTPPNRKSISKHTEEEEDKPRSNQKEELAEAKEEMAQQEPE